MLVIQYLAIAAAIVCVFSLLTFFLKIVRLGAPKDLSEKSGNTSKGIAYSNTTAMLPQNKESAYLHIPGYAAGMLFHIGTFVSLFLFASSIIP